MSSRPGSRIRWSRVAMALAVVVAGLLDPAGGARAFEVFEGGLRWRNSRARYFINANFPPLAGSEEHQIEILRCAADSWRDQTAADFRFDYLGQTATTEFSPDDNLNAVFYLDVDADDIPGANGALASTFIWGVGNQLTDFDMVFFGRTGGRENRWSGEGQPEPGVFDLWGTAVHEFGHAVGLDHTSVTGATMVPALQNRGLTFRTLHPDDRAGAEFLYGTREGFDTTPSLFAVFPFEGPAAGENELLIEGRNFTWEDDTELRLGPSVIARTALRVETCGRIVVPTVPPGPAGAVDIELSNSLGTARLSAGYVYRLFPEVAAIEPVTGPLSGGIPVAIVGERFGEESEVLIGGELVEDLQFVSSTRLRGTLPPGPRAGPVDVEVSVGFETATLEGAFTYREDFVEFSASPLVPGIGSQPIDILVTHRDPIVSLSLTFFYEPDMLHVLDVSTEGTVAADAQIRDVTIDNTVGLVSLRLELGSEGDVVLAIPAGEQQAVARVLVEPVVNENTSTDLIFPDPAAYPELAAIWTTAGEFEIAPLTVDSTVQISELPTFVRGDADLDGTLALNDPVLVLFALFDEEVTLVCPDAADADDNGFVEITDPIVILRHAFLRDTAPAAPYPQLGVDPTPDALDCPLR